MISLTLPYPPSANRYWRVWRGRAVMSREAREYKKKVGEMLQELILGPLDGPISVFMDFYRPRRRGDIDNAQKVALDACNGHVWLDDKQIVFLCASRYDDKNNPRVELHIIES